MYNIYIHSFIYLFIYLKPQLTGIYIILYMYIQIGSYCPYQNSLKGVAQVPKREDQWNISFKGMCHEKRTTLVIHRGWTSLLMRRYVFHREW